MIVAPDQRVVILPCPQQVRHQDHLGQRFHRSKGWGRLPHLEYQLAPQVARFAHLVRLSRVGELVAHDLRRPDGAGL
jgi:hypothetical protein